MKKMVNDKRVHPRYKTKFPIKICDSGLGTISTATINISVGGAYCTVPNFVAPMTKMMLKMIVPYHQKNGTLKEGLVQCEAVVIHTKPEKEDKAVDNYEIGLLFVNLKEKDKNKIQIYIKQHLEMLNS